VATTIVDDVTDALDLVSCALFRRVDDRFVREAERGWDDTRTATFDAAAGAPLALGARPAPLAVRDARWPDGLFPSGRRAPLDAVPILVRGELRAVIFIGEHAGGERPDPEELALLVELGRSMSVAYEHLEATHALHLVETLRSENAALRDIAFGAATRGSFADLAAE
jgi:hypothetical protein